MSTEKNGRKWRYRCPEGHVQWEERADEYYCEQCDRMGDDPYFDFLRESEPGGFHY